MATLTVESISTRAANTPGAYANLTITKPTGLEVGDLMVAVLIGWDEGTTWNTLSGWTEQAEISDTETSITGRPFIAVQTKIADSGDVAASNFTFTQDSGGSIVCGGLIFRVSNPDPTNIPGAIETDSSGANTASISFGSSLDPGTDDTLIIAAIAAVKSTGSLGIGDISLTPSATMTEAYNYSGGDIYAAQCDYYVQTTQTSVTNYAATATDTSINHCGVILAVRPNHPSSGTTALLEPNVQFIAPTAQADTNGTSGLKSVSPTFPSGTAAANTGTTWQRPTKNSTTWYNENK